ncbi:regulatory protein GemA [Shewanella xiamenensis]|uniref:regulatory protein GemA n=1 Tax=Shewanella xiamenensis TaxID=332186 RepID=UPI0008499B7B|nr:regulatory protein GemA [Shewanella xiamenensis]
MMSRRSLLAQIHIATKQLLMSDERYRDLLKQHGAQAKDGCYSATSMSVAQLQNVVDGLKTMGFTTTRPQKTRRKNTPQVSKLYAIWCEMYRQRVVKQKGFLAMVTWCNNQLPDLPLDINDASAFQLNQLIESMKQWHQRLTIPIPV